MGEKKLPKFLTTGEFKQHVVNWSDDTIYRRIKSEGLPAQKMGDLIFSQPKRFLIGSKEEALRLHESDTSSSV
jgi:hypothetical protein